MEWPNQEFLIALERAAGRSDSDKAAGRAIGDSRR